MNNKLNKQDEYILKAFLGNKIPDIIKEETVNGFDLMEYYEELFNYSDSILRGIYVNFNLNSIGTKKAFIFDQRYKNILINLSNKNHDLDLTIHCYLTLATLLTLEKYSFKIM